MRKTLSQYVLSASLLCFTSASTFGQNVEKPSDLKEFGLSGKVKTVSVFSYSPENLKKDSSRWKVQSQDDFTSKKVYYFNRHGNTDSLCRFGKSERSSQSASRKGGTGSTARRDHIWIAMLPTNRPSGTGTAKIPNGTTHYKTQNILPDSNSVESESIA